MLTPQYYLIAAIKNNLLSEWQNRNSRHNLTLDSGADEQDPPCPLSSWYIEQTNPWWYENPKMQENIKPDPSLLLWQDLRIVLWPSN